MSGCNFVDKLVVHNHELQNSSKCGVVIAAEGESLRILEYTSVMNTSFYVGRLEKKIAEEAAIISSLQEKINRLRTKASEGTATAHGASGGLEVKMLQWAKSRLTRIPPNDFRSISLINVPSECTRLVCSAVTAALGNHTTVVPWSQVQMQFRDDKLIEHLCSLDQHPITEALLKSIIDIYYKNRSFSYEYVAKESSPVAALHKWLTAFVDFQRASFGGTYKMEIAQQIEACANGIKDADERRRMVQEDLELTRQGLLVRRASNVWLIPKSSVVYVLEDSSVFSKNQVVLRGAQSHLRGNGADNKNSHTSGKESITSSSQLGGSCSASKSQDRIGVKKKEGEISNSSSHDSQSDHHHPSSQSASPPRVASILAAENISLKRENMRLEKLLLQREQQLVHYAHLSRNLGSVSVELSALSTSQSLLIADYLEIQSQQARTEKGAEELLYSLQRKNLSVARLQDKVKMASREAFLTKAIIQMFRTENTLLRNELATLKKKEPLPNGDAPSAQLDALGIALRDASEYLGGYQLSTADVNAFQL